MTMVNFSVYSEKLTHLIDALQMIFLSFAASCQLPTHSGSVLIVINNIDHVSSSTSHLKHCPKMWVNLTARNITTFVIDKLFLEDDKST